MAIKRLEDGMPELKLDGCERREIITRVISGEHVTKLAEEYRVSRQHIYQMYHDALASAALKSQNADEEARFRELVVKHAIARQETSA
jgi:hypothetical protein